MPVHFCGVQTFVTPSTRRLEGELYGDRDAVDALGGMARFEDPIVRSAASGSPLTATTIRVAA